MEVIPAEYGTETETVEVSPAKTRLIPVPATYESYTENCRD